MQFSIISAEEEQKFIDVKSITLPAFWGKLQILPDYAESFIILQAGEVILEGDKTNTIPVEGGVCYVKDNVVLIIS